METNMGGIFYWIMCCFKGVVIAADYVFDAIFGYTFSHGTRIEREWSQKYESSAQVVHVIGRGAYTIIMSHQLSNFIGLHERYAHPRHVLEHDNITLMGATPTHVFFCVSSPFFDVFETKESIMFARAFH
jgi:hypothetical protein